MRPVLKKYCVPLAEICFLAGVALLIVRKNDFPWPLKRASDVLFFASGGLSVFFLLATSQAVNFYHRVRNVILALLLLFAGMAMATLANFLQSGQSVDATGILSISRFLEAGLLVLLPLFFQTHRDNFIAKFAVAQLSTLFYLLVFIIPNDLHIHMPRFELWENWPSNVSYYVLVSLSFLLVLLLERIYPLRKQTFYLYVPTVGLTGILLWTQSRASWLAFLLIGLLSLGYVISQSRRGGIRFFFTAVVALALLLPLAFLLLRPITRFEVLTRIFPGARPFLEQTFNFRAASAGGLTKEFLRQDLTPVLSEPSRPYLWRTYGKMLLAQPLGFGVNYPLVQFGGSWKGPHNTLLEDWVIVGPLGLGAVIYLFWLAFQNLLRLLCAGATARWPLYLFLSLAALVLVAMFDNMSTFRLTWIVLGLSLGLANARST